MEFPIVVDASARPAALLCALRSVAPEAIVSSLGGHFVDVALPLSKCSGAASGLHRAWARRSELGSRFGTGREWQGCSGTSELVHCPLQ